MEAYCCRRQLLIKGYTNLFTCNEPPIVKAASELIWKCTYHLSYVELHLSYVEHEYKYRQYFIWRSQQPPFILCFILRFNFLWCDYTFSKIPRMLSFWTRIMTKLLLIIQKTSHSTIWRWLYCLHYTVLSCVWLK